MVTNEIREIIDAGVMSAQKILEAVAEQAIADGSVAAWQEAMAFMAQAYRELPRAAARAARKLARSRPKGAITPEEMAVMGPLLVEKTPDWARGLNCESDWNIDDEFRPLRKD